MLTLLIVSAFLVLIRVQRAQGEVSQKRGALDIPGELIFIAKDDLHYQALSQKAEKHSPYLGLVSLSQEAPLWSEKHDFHYFLDRPLLNLSDLAFRPIPMESFAPEQEVPLMTPYRWSSVLPKLSLRLNSEQVTVDRPVMIHIASESARKWRESEVPSHLVIPDSPLVYTVRCNSLGEVLFLFATRSPLKQSELQEWNHWVRKQQFLLRDLPESREPLQSSFWAELKIQRS